MAVVFVSIIVHEMGHALAARNFGMHPDITLWGFGGLTSFSFQRFEPRQSILITLAGPFAGFALAGLILATLMLTRHEIVIFGLTVGHGVPVFEVDRNLYRLVYYLLLVNIFWGVVNLFPILPLDGGQITRDVLIISQATRRDRTGLHSFGRRRGVAGGRESGVTRRRIPDDLLWLSGLHELHDASGDSWRWFRAAGGDGERFGRRSRTGSPCGGDASDLAGGEQSNA